MAHYIALIHKDANNRYGVSFPNVPGMFAVANTIDEAIRKAKEVLEFAAEDRSDLSSGKFAAPRIIDELRTDPDFQERAGGGVIAAVPFRMTIERAAS